MTQAVALPPSDQDLIAFIKQKGVVTAGYAAHRFNLDRDLMREQLKRLRAEGKLKSESVKVRTKVHGWKYTTDWSVTDAL